MPSFHIYNIGGGWRPRYYKKFVGIFANNTQGYFLNKTRKIRGIWFLKSCGYPEWSEYATVKTLFGLLTDVPLWLYDRVEWVIFAGSGCIRNRFPLWQRGRRIFYDLDGTSEVMTDSVALAVIFCIYGYLW